MSHRGLRGWLIGFAVVVILSGPRAANAQQPTAGTVAAGVVPGERMRLIRSVSPEMDIAPEPDRRFDGSLVDIDSGSVTLRLDDGSERRFVRGEIETLRVNRGRSRWRGLLAGWLAGLPVSVVACRNEKYECGAGSGIGLVSGLAGIIIGWPNWDDVRFPGG